MPGEAEVLLPILPGQELWGTGTFQTGRGCLQNSVPLRGIFRFNLDGEDTPIVSHMGGPAQSGHLWGKSGLHLCKVRL